MSAALDMVKKAFAERHERCRALKSRGRRFLGLTCTYIPEELVLAAGGVPVRVTPLLGDTPNADAYLPVNVCSTMKACLEAALRGVYDYLDAVVFSNSCDNMGRVYDIWRLRGAVDRFHLFNTPHSRHEAARRLLHYELRRFKSFLEGLFAKPIGEEDVRSAASLMNRLRLNLKRLEALKAENPPLLTGVEGFYAVASSMTLPKEDAIEMVERLLEEPPSQRSELKDRPRIFVTSSYVDDEARLLSLIEDAGGVVVAEDTCTGSRYYDRLVEERGDIYESLAERYLWKTPCAFVEHSEDRLTSIKEAVNRFNVDGVVIWVVRFCDVYLFDAPVLAEELRGMGVPCIVLEWSTTEAEWAPIKTRVEAFIESLRG